MKEFTYGIYKCKDSSNVNHWAILQKDKKGFIKLVKYDEHTAGFWSKAFWEQEFLTEARVLLNSDSNDELLWFDTDNFDEMMEHVFADVV